MLTVSDTDLGTSEAEWSGSGALDGLAALRWRPGAPVVVVAPHPDDEVLGAGGLLRAAQRTGSSITLVAVTDGEASHPGSTVTPGELARRRREESARGLRCLGLDDVEVRRCGLPDGDVAASEAELVAVLRGLVAPGSVVLTTWRHDGHPDHEATGRAVAEVAERVGSRLLEAPIWAWHWATPSAGLPLDRARRWDLTPGDRAAKGAAIRAHRSQVEPLGPDPADRVVLPPAVRVRFERPFEIFLEDDPG